MTVRTPGYEFGHGLGIGHSQYSAATMYYRYSRCSTAPRTLHTDDLAALRCDRVGREHEVDRALLQERLPVVRDRLDPFDGVGLESELAGNPVDHSAMMPMPTLWALRPVRRQARVGEHIAVVWKLA